MSKEKWNIEYEKNIFNGNKTIALKYKNKINLEINNQKHILLDNISLYLKVDLKINDDVELFLEQYVENEETSFLSTIEFWYNFCMFTLLRLSKENKNNYENFSEFHKKLYAICQNIRDKIKAYCQYELISINEEKNKSIFIPINENILINSISDSENIKSKLSNWTINFYKTLKLDEKENIIFQINKIIFDYIGDKHIDEIDLFNIDKMKEYRNYANCIRHDSKDSLNNKKWREQNWDNLTDEIKSYKLKEFLIISLEIYVWLNFKNII